MHKIFNEFVHGVENVHHLLLTKANISGVNFIGIDFGHEYFLAMEEKESVFLLTWNLIMLAFNEIISLLNVIWWKWLKAFEVVHVDYTPTNKQKISPKILIIFWKSNPCISNKTFYTARVGSRIRLAWTFNIYIYISVWLRLSAMHAFEVPSFVVYM